jgi:3-isopropylmalate/(R)-2-methylmalate dehydratase small subunit
VWKFGDNIPTHHFLSGKYDPLVRAGKYADLVQHVLEDHDPTFVSRVQRGDLLVCGRGFGMGKHVRGLIGAFKLLGVGGLIAETFAAEWERATINAGFPCLVYSEVAAAVEPGDELELDVRATTARNLTQGVTFTVRPTPEGIIDILEAGGLEEFTMKRLGLAAS